MTTHAIIDCDPGHDDVMAILLAARTLDLRGITTVHGNTSLANTTTNARKTVEFAELTDIPIAAGMPRPLVREAHHAPEVHGESGLDGPTLPSPTVPILDQHAVEFIIERSHDVTDLHLMPVGPLTNIASALIKDPTLSSRIKQISLMGGSLTFGNVTPAAEFNIWCDPDAAHVVFTSGIPIRMIGLNVTRQVLATRDRRDRIRSMGKATTTHVADMLDFYAHGEGQYSGLDGGAMHDPLAVAALVDPAILTFEPMHVAVELTGTHTAGMTLCDGRRTDPVKFRSYPTVTQPVEGTEMNEAGPPPNAQVAVAVDVGRFWSLFLDVLATYP
jgi:inosine-uridine nucleoside N-ribohydrolase